MLTSWHVCVVKSDLAASYHRHVQVHRVFEVVHQLLEGNGTLADDNLIVVGVTLWDAFDWAAHDWIELFGLVPLDFIGFTKEEQRESEVDETILELVHFSKSLHKLEDLVGNCSSNHCSRGCNGGDNLAGDKFRLVEISFVDLIVACT